jgi:hypothetical protein
MARRHTQGAIAVQAATLTPPANSPQGTPPAEGVAAPVVPFVRASYEHTEPANIDESRQLTTSSQLIGPVDVPSYGYLRSLLILVTTSGGSGGSAVGDPDAPYNALAEVALHDVNGAPIVGPFNGYDLFLANKWGGYAAFDDPALHPSFQSVQAASGQFGFMLRVPVEVNNRDALGALPNMNASSTYKLRLTLAPSTDIYDTPPATTLPTVRVRVWAECWAPPSASNDLGQPQAIQPPALGTTQMWSRNISSITAGANTVPFKRVGNLIRALILVHRNASGLRLDANLPDPVQLYIDGRLLTNEGLAVRRGYMRERYGVPTASIDTGVLVFDFAHDFDGRMGGELRDGWLQTATSTRLEVVGSFANAGALTILTNDVAPVGNVYLD